MQIEDWPIGRPTPYDRNPRDNQAAIETVAASIQEFGFRQPIVVDEDGIILVGHTRLEAAKRLQLKTVPVHVAEGLTDAQKRQYRLADNRVGEDARWDEGLLKLEIADLRDMGADVGLTGFSDREINDLFKVPTQGNTDPDATPNLPDVPVTRPGDCWYLGEHRLFCGDATSEDDVAALLVDDAPHLMVTDPPYGVEYKPEWRAEAGVNKNTGKLGQVENDHRADWREAWALFPGDVAYVWHADKFTAVVFDSLESQGFEVRAQIIWAKERFALSRGHYHWQHEPCWYAVKNHAHWVGDRSQSTLWPINAREDSGVGHGTQKPVECMRRPIHNNSNIGDAVYEPFSGSGTTIIACEQTGRRCLAMELNPAYVDVAVERWQAFAKQTAFDRGGRPFAEVRNARQETEADAA